MFISALIKKSVNSNNTDAKCKDICGVEPDKDFDEFLYGHYAAFGKENGS